jgi:ABC-type phosphate transport system ATPase subunit
MVTGCISVSRAFRLEWCGELIKQGQTETIFTKSSDSRTKAYIEGCVHPKHGRLLKFWETK